MKKNAQVVTRPVSKKIVLSGLFRFLERPTGLYLAIAVSVAVRLAYVFFFLGLDFNYIGSATTDSFWYDAVARAIINHPMNISTALHPPLYPLFISAIYALFTPGYIQVACAQIIVDVGTLIVVWLLARKMTDKATAGVTAFLYALYPSFIFYCGHLISEVVYIFLLMLSILLLLTYSQSGGRGRLVASGVALGLSALTRANALLVVLLLMLWSLKQFSIKKGILVWLALIIIALAVITPWMVRNYLVLDAFVPISTGGGGSFWGGNNENAVGYYYKRVDTFPDQVNPGPAEVEMSHKLYLQGWEWIKENPGAYIRLLTLKAWRFIEPYPQMQNAPTDRLYAVVGIASHLLLLPFLIIGVVLVVKDNRWIIPGLFILAHLLTALVFFGGIRMRDPIMPVVLIIVALGVMWALKKFLKAGMKKLNVDSSAFIFY